MPTMRSKPKPRTIGIGESWRARKPAAVARQAVAIVGPPPAAADARRLDAGSAPLAIASSKRAWNWIA